MPTTYHKQIDEEKQETLWSLLKEKVKLAQSGTPTDFCELKVSFFIAKMPKLRVNSGFRAIFSGLTLFKNQ